MTKRCAQHHRSVLVVFIFHARTDRIWPPVLGQLDSRIYRPSKRSSPGTVSFRAFTHALKNQCLPPRVTIVINGEKKLANDLRKISLPPSLHFDPFEEEREEIGRRIVERILAHSRSTTRPNFTTGAKPMLHNLHLARVSPRLSPLIIGSV